MTEWNWQAFFLAHSSQLFANTGIPSAVLTFVTILHKYNLVFILFYPADLPVLGWNGIESPN